MLLTFGDDESSFNNLVGSKTVKEWSKYLSFKVSYHKSIALLFQGQQAEEQQKMGERVAFYQAACEQLEEARKLSSGLKQQKVNIKRVGDIVVYFVVAGFERSHRLHLGRGGRKAQSGEERERVHLSRGSP